MKQATVIILAGQSNAVGVGHVQYLPKHFSPEKIREFKAGYPRIPINYFSHDKKSGGFVPTEMGCTELSKDTLGPEVGMAERLTEALPEENIFIVKCAYGGTALWRDWLSPSGGAEYDPTADADQTPDVLASIAHGEPLRAGWCYNELVKLTRESLATLEAEGYRPVIRGFCWMQGEGDADVPAHAEGYSARYDALLRDFSAAFSPYMEGCIFADGGISQIWPLWQELNADKRAYAESHENCVFVDTVAHGLCTREEPEEEPDIYHYDLGSTVKLGRLFAEALLGGWR